MHRAILKISLRKQIVLLLVLPKYAYLRFNGDVSILRWVILLGSGGWSILDVKDMMVLLCRVYKGLEM